MNVESPRSIRTVMSVIDVYSWGIKPRPEYVIAVKLTAYSSAQTQRLDALVPKASIIYCNMIERLAATFAKTYLSR